MDFRSNCAKKKKSSKLPSNSYMLFIFPILFVFSFFIWTCSVLMMMQKTRCESAAAQGLRSDTIQANEMAASACERLPHPSLPLACWLWTPPSHFKPASLPKTPPPLSDNIDFSKKNKKNNGFWRVCRPFNREIIVYWLLISKSPPL